VAEFIATILVIVSIAAPFVAIYFLQRWLRRKFRRFFRKFQSVKHAESGLKQLDEEDDETQLLWSLIDTSSSGSYIAAKLHAPKAVNDLVDEASKYYPHEDTAKALELFLKALLLAPDAPDDPQVQEGLDSGSSIGFAVWAAFTCMDLLYSSEEEQTKFRRLAERKSPVTVRRYDNEVESHSAKMAERKKAESKRHEADVLLSQKLTAIEEGQNVHEMVGAAGRVFELGSASLSNRWARA
jgi:hypothetical protein